MPDTKITALTAIATVDPAVDVLPIVDVSDTSMAASGTTKKITSNQILGAGGTATLASATITGAATAARLVVTGSTAPANGVYLPAANSVGIATNSIDAIRIDASQNVGIGVTPSAGAGCLQLASGINFPVTQVANANANTLDDYEEGTWTGTLTGGTTDPTTSVTATGRYTKIGRQVQLQINFDTVNTTGASGAVRVTGVPFVSGAISFGSLQSENGITFTGTIGCYIAASGSTIIASASASNGSRTDGTHNAGTSRFFWMTLTYTV